MKKLICLALLALTAAAKADLVLEASDGSRLVVFADGGRVFYEKCAADQKAKLARGCSGADRSTMYSMEADRYARSVQSFYGVVDRLYAGVQGGQRLAEKIAGLQAHLDQDEFTADELHNAENVLLGFVRINDKLERANREILQYLSPDVSTTLNQEYQGQRYAVVNLSFYNLAYFPERHKIYRFSDAVTFDQSAGACARFAPDWRQLASTSAIDHELRAWLTVAPLIPAGEVLRVWTSGASSGYYKISCNSSYQGGERYHSFPPSVHTFSPQELRQKEYQASQSYQGMSLCQYIANGVEVGREYVPGVSTVVDLGNGGSGETSEPVEAGEGSISGNAHPALCEKDFEFKTGDSDAGYLNGEHFADFSIYHLEQSLELMAKSVYSNRAEFFRAVAKTLGEFPLRETDDIRVGFHVAGGRLFVLLAIEPLLHDIQSKFVDNYVLPDYNRAKEQWSKRLGVEKLTDIYLAAPSYKLALTLLTHGLKASEGYLNADDKKALQALVPELGKALAAGPNGLAQVNKVLQGRGDLFKHLSEGRRTHGFGEMATAIAGYLEKAQK